MFIFASYLSDPFGFRITNSPIADVFIVWAKCEDKRVRGFILEKVCSFYKIHKERMCNGLTVVCREDLYYCVLIFSIQETPNLL